MTFPPFRIGQPVRLLKTVTRPSEPCGTATVAEGREGEVVYYRGDGSFTTRWTDAVGHPQTVHPAEDWGDVVASKDQKGSE